jgi:hypothetical protein
MWIVGPSLEANGCDMFCNNEWVLLQTNLARLPPSSLSSNFSVLEISTGDYGDHNEALVAAIQNGKCNDWRRRQMDRSSFSYQGKPASYPLNSIM